MATMPSFDHTGIEKELIKEFGGEPTQSFGADGTLGGDPVEVRLAKKENRFRLNCDTHDTLLSEDGSYLFDDLQDNKPPKQVSADEVDSHLPEGDCFSDRGYEHKFISVDDIF